MKQKTFVYVLNTKGKPLMPTTRCGHIRKRLKESCSCLIIHLQQYKSPFALADG